MVLGAAILLIPGALASRSFDEPDAETERCLAEGKLLKKGRKTLTGVTAPELYTLVCDGRERRVVVKRVDKTEFGITRFDDGTWEMGFTDSFRYERAAYLLDRELAIDMVPVAVIREVDRQPSALIEFIENAHHEDDSPHAPSAAERVALLRAKAVMAIFDALIFNTDRNKKNWLVDDADWRLYLIDHSRAFRTLGELPASYPGIRSCLPVELYERLRGLTGDRVLELLGPLITERQITALMARREKLIERIETDRRGYGDDVVFCVPMPADARQR